MVMVIKATRVALLVAAAVAWASAIVHALEFATLGTARRSNGPIAPRVPVFSGGNAAASSAANDASSLADDFFPSDMSSSAADDASSLAFTSSAADDLFPSAVIPSAADDASLLVFTSSERALLSFPSPASVDGSTSDGDDDGDATATTPPTAASDGNCRWEGNVLRDRSATYFAGRAHRRGSVFGECASGVLSCYEDAGLADAENAANAPVACDSRAILQRGRALDAAASEADPRPAKGRHLRRA